MVFSNYRPRSRGTVRLASRNPFDAPLIDPKYFSDARDLASAVRITSIGLRTLESQYMAPYVESSRLPVCLVFFVDNFPLSFRFCFKTVTRLCTTFLWF